MKDKKKIIIVSLFTIGIIIGIYLYFTNKKYKYICFNTDVIKETIIVENYLEQCISNKKLPKGVITDKRELLTNDTFTSYKQIKDLYKEGEMLYKDDFILYEYPKATETDIKLLTEVQVMYHGKSSEEENIKYKVYINDKKLSAINLNTNEERVIFDKEEVDFIAVRPLCCTGNGHLLILTTIGNVYISKYDCNYSFSFDFPFNKLEATNIVSLKLIPANDGDWIKNLYGVDSNGKEILLQKIN